MTFLFENLDSPLWSFKIWCREVAQLDCNHKVCPANDTDPDDVWPLEVANEWLWIGLRWRFFFRLSNSSRSSASLPRKYQRSLFRGGNREGVFHRLSLSLASCCLPPLIQSWEAGAEQGLSLCLPCYLPLPPNPSAPIFLRQLTLWIAGRSPLKICPIFCSQTWVYQRRNLGV